ncbi:MAG: restriction endonuclease subunit S [Proteobacteria bacterium]|nr:restriction endonuclease subunit S [Pseudomonadota bacterium]MCG2749193.1 restriction endonuclease subunit S [Desulfobulbaceae bacterium]
MSEWKSVRLDECCKIVSGATPSTSIATFWDGDIYWATPKDLSDLEDAYISDTPRKLTRAGLDSCGATILPVGSVLFSSRAPIGHVAVNTVPMATNQGFKSFVPKTDIIYSKFLFYWLRKNRPYLESLGNGATFKEVSKAIVSRIEIPLPPLAEQKRIAAILDKADAIRRKRQAAIKLADDFLRATFLDMFGDPVTNPKGWDLVSLGDVSVKVQDGNYGGKYPRSDELLPEGEIPFLTSACVGEGGIIKFDHIRYLSKKRNSELTKVSLSGRDILFTNRGANFGLSAIVPECLKSGNIGPQLTQMKLDENKMFPEVLVMILNHQGINEKLRSLNSGSAMNFLGLAATKSFRIFCPPVTLQDKYLQLAQKTIQLNRRQEEGASFSSILFNSLTQRAFQGEL